MIFDDDTKVLAILKDYFSILNFEVQAFSEPLLCLPSDDKNSCINPCADIIITDFQMPRINGVELLGHQIQQGCPINIKNKAIMSGALPAKYADYMEGLADAFFQKPIRLHELNIWVTECIGRNDLLKPLGNYFV